MALVNMKEMLKKAQREGYAVANFDILNGEMLRGVINAAEEKKAPVILAYAEVFEPISPMEEFAPMLRAAAERATVPVAVHLDHARTIRYIEKAVEHGFTSVMLDASDQPFAENIAMTRKVVELCAPHRISVESELGHVGGLEGYAYGGAEDAPEDGYTVVAEAAEFVRETGIDALAVAIGTVHGVYKSEPKLSMERLTELRQAIEVPLVMHGGSGLADDDFRRAIKKGITKTNIFTDLTLRAIEAMKENQSQEYFNINTAVIDAVCKEAIRKIMLFGSAGKA